METEEKNSATQHEIAVKNGKPLLTSTYAKIKFITASLVILLAITLLFSLKLFISAIKIRSHIGYYINLISSGDGDVLPSLQAVPVLFFVLVNVAMAFLLYKAFDPIASPKINRFMFVAVIANFTLIIVLFIIIISVIAHAYSEHISLHDGIVVAMNNYSSNPAYKEQMDRLQIEFQCCGSKKYDEWYTIKWYDSTLQKEEGNNSADGNTPFSCCSIKSLFPCIHHNIEVTGKSYLYTPEFNLSISTRGCYEIIRERKQSVGWAIVGNLFLFIMLQGLILTTFRFLQTAHFEKSLFEGSSRIYTMWLFGSYSGKVKKEKPIPEPPPIPPELMQ